MNTIISEEEKNRILEQHKSELENKSENTSKPRRVNAYNIKSLDFTRFENQGLTPYFYNKDVESENFGMVKLEKSNKKILDTRTEVFLLTQEEFDKIKKYSDIVKSLILSELKKISLLKELVPSTLVEIMKLKS
jgi:hypothetical protein